MRLPSPALVISLIALFVALGGTSYAVTQLPRNSVGPPQLQKSAVTSQKLKASAVTSRTIAKGAVSEGKIADGAVTGAAVKDGSLAAADLSAAARAEVRGPAPASATATSRDLQLVDVGVETPVLSTSIAVSHPARLLIDGAVTAAFTDTGTVTPSWVPFLCWATLNGAQVGGTSSVGVIDGHLNAGATMDVTAPIAAGAEVEPGTHAVGISCLGGYEVLSRTLNVAALPR